MLSAKHDDDHTLIPQHIDPEINLETISLRPEEKLLTAHFVESQTPRQPLTPLKALQLLAGVTQPEDIGKQGPVVAAMANIENHTKIELRLYEVVFGRDSLITALFLMETFPNLMRATIVRLAELQGTTTHPAREEEPGKIVHEARATEDPIAQLLNRQRGWEWPYYGTVDATPLFVNAIGMFTKKYGTQILEHEYIDTANQLKKISDAVYLAITWIKKKMDENQQGFIESHRQNTIGGNLIQSWKDSIDSHHHADGTLVYMSNGIASIEVQGLAHDALQYALELQEELHLSSQEAQDVKSRMNKLKTSVLEHFWIKDKDGYYFALGGDRESPDNVHPLCIRTSNMGHLLHSSLLDGQDSTSKKIRDELVKTLFSPNLFGKYGIRTLATNENRYRPNSYHNGSIWPWDNFYISLGLQRHGYSKEARLLWNNIVDIIQATGRFPEFISGEDTPIPHLPDRTIKVLDTKLNIQHAIEQPPQEIQAWTVASIIAIEKLCNENTP